MRPMHRLSGALLLGVLSLTVTEAHAGPPRSYIEDVPANHWALQAIGAITDAGIQVLPCFGPLKFHGEKLLNQYQVLVILQRVNEIVRSRGGDPGRVLVKRSDLTQLLARFEGPQVARLSDYATAPAIKAIRTALEQDPADQVLVDAVSLMTLDIVVTLAESDEAGEVPSSPLARVKFSDVPRNHWANESVYLTAQLGFWDWLDDPRANP